MLLLRKFIAQMFKWKNVTWKKTLFGIHLVNCHHHHYFYEWHLWHKHHWWLVIFKNSKFHNHYEWWLIHKLILYMFRNYKKIFCLINFFSLPIWPLITMRKKQNLNFACLDNDNHHYHYHYEYCWRKKTKPNWLRIQLWKIFFVVVVCRCKVEKKRKSVGLFLHR